MLPIILEILYWIMARCYELMLTKKLVILLHFWEKKDISQGLHFETALLHSPWLERLKIRKNCKSSPFPNAQHIKSNASSASIANQPLPHPWVKSGGGATDPFRGMEAWRNSTETQQSGNAPRSGPEVIDGRSNAKDGALERLRCGTI